MSLCAKMQRYPQFGAFRDFGGATENKEEIISTTLLTKRVNGIILATVKCKDCKEDFTPSRKWQAYCSIKCGNRARYKRRYARIQKAFRALQRQERTA